MTETKLDPKEERRYAQLRKLGQELHIPIPEHFWTLEVFDKNGKLLQRHHQRSHSWVRNAYHVIFVALAGVPNDAADSLDAKDTSGAALSSTDEILTLGGASANRIKVDSSWSYRGSADDDENGIVVGSSALAEDFEHYALQTQIASGVGPGDLSYVASEDPSVSTEGTTKKAEWIRYFNNNSGGAIDVNETALYTYCTFIGAPKFWMSCRDKLVSTVTVPDTGQLKVTYTISLTYPS